MPAVWRHFSALVAITGAITAQSYSAPAGLRPALRRGGASILPGGRVVAPLGEEYIVGAGAFGLAVSPSGKTVVTANIGPWGDSLTILDHNRSGRWEPRQLVVHPAGIPEKPEAAVWLGVSGGVAFSGERTIYSSEGYSGRINIFDSNDERRRPIDINQNGYRDSFTGDIAFDAERNILYVADQANFRVAVIDGKSRQVVASVRVGRLPFALALSPDRRKLYVTNVGIFANHALPAGLAFPAFGFPSAEALAALGDPNAPESNSLCVVDVAEPAAAKVLAFVRTGLPFGGEHYGGSSPSGIVATADRVFVSNANDDSVSVIDPKTNGVLEEIPIRIPGLEGLRGVVPAGMAYDEGTGWLLVAETGVNAVGVIDTRNHRLLGHLPAAWNPTRVAIAGDSVLVSNAKGHGFGPDNLTGAAERYQGSLSTFPLPGRYRTGGANAVGDAGERIQSLCQTYQSARWHPACRFDCERGPQL